MIIRGASRPRQRGRACSGRHLSLAHASRRRPRKVASAACLSPSDRREKVYRRRHTAMNFGCRRCAAAVQVLPFADIIEKCRGPALLSSSRRLAISACRHALADAFAGERRGLARLELLRREAASDELATYRAPPRARHMVRGAIIYTVHVERQFRRAYRRRILPARRRYVITVFATHILLAMGMPA